MTAEQDLEYPHTYKRQREFERQARKSDERASTDPSIRNPPKCGFTYTKKIPRNRTNFTPGTETCVRVAGAGTTHQGHGYCDYHEVQAAKETAKGKRGMTKQVQEAKKIAYTNSNLFGERIPTDPHMALMDEISRTSSIIAWIESHMVEMKDGGMTEDAILTQFTKQNGFVAGVWMELYQKERTHLVSTCLAAIKAGVAERRVQIAEQQGQLIVGMMMAFLHDPEMGLSPEQLTNGPKIMKKHMLALPTAEPQGNEAAALATIEAVAQEA